MKRGKIGEEKMKERKCIENGAETEKGERKRKQFWGYTERRQRVKQRKIGK